MNMRNVVTALAVGVLFGVLALSSALISANQRIIQLEAEVEELRNVITDDGMICVYDCVEGR